MAKAIQNNKNTAGGLAYPYEDRPVPETLDAMLDRTACFIDQVIAPFIFDSGDAVDGSQIENILICGHGALNRALLMNFRGINDLREFWGTGLQPNCGITKITCTCDDRGRIIYDVQDECMVLYDKELEKGLKKLL